MKVIPVLDLNSQSVETVLDDELFYIDIDWNEDGQYWQMGIRNSAYNSIVDGISLVPNYPLTWQFKYSDMPKGELQAIRLINGNGPIPRDGFSSGVFQLIYMTYMDTLLAPLVVASAV